MVKRVCVWCGKEFETNSGRKKVCNDEHFRPCPDCGAPVKIVEKSYAEFLKHGPRRCTECARKAALKTRAEKSKEEKQRILERRKATNRERFGTDYASQAPEIKQKAADTMMGRYGVVKPLQSKEIQAAMRQRNLEKYGVENTMQIPEVAARMSQILKEHSQENTAKQRAGTYRRYGVYNAMQCPAVVQKLSRVCQEKYGVAFACMLEQCRKSYNCISKINKQFAALLTDAHIPHALEFPLVRYNYDFKIGDVLVEIDPTSTHNSAMSIFKDTAPTAPDYHLCKSQVAWEHGYRCIHVFDWDDWHKVVQLLLPTEAVYARKCELQKIDKVTADKFTAEYHISGRCNGQLENYGLFFESELVEVMTFGKPRYNKNYDYELLRLCTKSGLRVVGGASRLFHRFVVEHPQVSVISYCDRAKFTGAVYEQIGMKLMKTTEPYKVWSRDDKKITQNLLNQRGYDQLFGTSFGKGTSNEQLMLDNGWLPVYDCGQLVYGYIPQSL